MSSRRFGGVDHLADRLGCRDIPAGDHLHDGDRQRPPIRLHGEVLAEVGGHRRTVGAETGEEHGLRLPDDVTRHTDHHVVEPAVLEVVLNAGTAGPRHDTVDHVQLAVLGAPHLVLAPVELAVDEQPVEVDLNRVVVDELGAGGHQLAVHRLGLTVGIRSLIVDEDPDLDALGQLVVQDRRKFGADLARVPAEHDDVDRRFGVADVVEDAWVELAALRPRLDRRSRAPCVVEVDIALVAVSRPRTARSPPAPAPP